MSTDTLTLSIILPLNVFSRFKKLVPESQFNSRRDLYSRLTLTYNDNYDPKKPPNLSKSINYSPFIPREPLYDDKPIHITSLRRYYTVVNTSKIKRRN